MTERINMAGDVIDAAGGSTAVARLFDVDVRVVSNWRKRGLPPETFHVLQGVLAKHGKEAPPSLWRQREAHEPSANAPQPEVTPEAAE